MAIPRGDRALISNGLATQQGTRHRMRSLQEPIFHSFRSSCETKSDYLRLYVAKRLRSWASVARAFTSGFIQSTNLSATNIFGLMITNHLACHVQ